MHHRTRTQNLFSPSSTPKENLNSKKFFTGDKSYEDMERKAVADAYNRTNFK